MRLVLAQVALALLVLAWAVHPGWALVAAPLAAPLAMPVRLRRPSRPPTGAMLLEVVRPGAVMTSVDIDGVDVGVVEDADGLAAVIRVGDLTDLLGDAPPPVPPLSTLLPAPAADLPQARIQLLVGATAAADPGAGATPSAVSYRQLTDGRLPARRQALLSVRIRRAGGFQHEDLERSLVAAVRRACRQLDRAGLPARPLSPPSALAALDEAAGHHPERPVRSTRRGLEVGGSVQAVFRLRRWPRDGPLADRLLTLPCSAVTVALTVAPTDPGGEDACRAEVTIRLAAPTPAALDQAAAALHRLTVSLSAETVRLGGSPLDALDPLDALAATLPLGGGAPPGAAALAGLLTGRDDLTLDGSAAARVSAAALAALTPSTGGDGLMLGVNRHGTPVVVRPFRAEPTRAVLIGGLGCAALLTLRALAVGAHVTVHSTRPDAWSPLLRGLRGEPISLLPAGQPADLPPPTAAAPQLLVIDTGPADGGGHASPPSPESAWRATLVVRDDLTAADTDQLTRADLVLLQPLTPAEAAIATDALGLTESASWLTRIAPEMLGIVVSRRTVRWAHLSPTPVELQLTGGPAR
ncbi:type VII secretion protein EccE [Dactylosporangium sp. NPDC050688]|uniref:type VII secretion protein EccE n=1 Tax=Dactylosporangium sp. NPDC050688 TaxID=3157217 RepID=UPI0033DF3B84